MAGKFYICARSHQAVKILNHHVTECKVVFPYILQFISLFAPHGAVGVRGLHFKVVNVIGIDCHFNVTAEMKLAILSSLYLGEFLKTFTVQIRQPYPKMDST